MKKFYILLFSLFVIAGCKTEEKITAKPKLNNSSLLKLISRASSGIKSANDSLSNLFDSKLPSNKNYNNLTIKEKNTDDSNFFFVLIEYPNPFYNRFAVYDENLRCYLIDKSLNGQLSEKIININGKSYVQINEGFLTKDIIQLNRTSLYQITNNNVSLVFRDFTKVKLPGREYTQVLKEFSDNKINAEINSTRRGYTPKEVSFTFNADKKMYESKDNTFDALIKYLINNFNHKTKNPQITDEQSAMKSVEKPS